MPPKVKCYTLKDKEDETYVTCNNNVKKGTKPKSKSLQQEAKDRTAKDGIQRLIKDGKIMKAKVKAKPKEEPKKKPIKFKVKAKPAPKKKPIKFNVKPKAEPKNEYGLTKAQANKLNPLELFGMLPQELRKKILTPKTTGVKVAKDTINAEDLQGGDLDPNNEIYSYIADNIGEGNSYNDYERYLTYNERKFMVAMRSKSRSEMSDKQINKLERIDEKVLHGIHDGAGEDFFGEIERFKKEYKGQFKKQETWEKLFSKWMDDNYF